MTDRDHPSIRIYNYDRQMIVHMTGLYTKLVTYARLHILTLVVKYQLYIVHNFVLDIVYSVIFHFSYHVVIACIVIMHEHLSLYTHTQALIRALLTALDSHVQDILDTLYCLGVPVIVLFARSWSFSFLDYRYSYSFIHFIP